MNRKFGLIVIPLVALALAACSGPTVGGGNASSGTPAASGPVKIGAIGPLTGPASTYGIAEQDGIQMAIDEWNAKKGLLGSKISLEVRDDKADPSTSTTQALQLVQADGVNAVFGPIINSCALAVAQISNQLAVPIVGTLGATTPVVYPDGPSKAPYPWVYRVLVSSPVQVKALVDYGTKHGLKKWAMVYENDAYGQPTVDDLKAALAKDGGKLVDSEAIAVDATDATAQAQAVVAAKPDVVLVWTVQAPASKVVAALAAAGSTAAVYSSNAQVSPQFYQLAGPQANGIVATGLKAQFDNSPAIQKFSTEYQAKFGIAPTLWAFASYDAAEIYFTAVKTAGTSDPKTVQAQLNKVTHTGITGKIGFTKQNHDGITSDDVTVVKIDNSAATPVS
jgi:branched-chain amino acid transport system substrate-binding protein